MKAVLYPWIASIGIHLSAIGGIGLYDTFSLTQTIPSSTNQVIPTTSTPDYTEYTRLERSIEFSTSKIIDRQKPDFYSKEGLVYETAFALSLTKINLPKEQELDLEKKILEIENMSEKEKIHTLEEYIKEAEKYPEKNLQEANQYIRNKAGIKQRAYEPIKEVQRIKDLNSIIPYYKTFKKQENGKEQEYIQRIFVDREGNYISEKPKLISQMTPQEKKDYDLFKLTNQNPWLKEMRNTAIDAVFKILNK